MIVIDAHGAPTHFLLHGRTANVTDRLTAGTSILDLEFKIG